MKTIFKMLLGFFAFYPVLGIITYMTILSNSSFLLDNDYIFSIIFKLLLICTLLSYILIIAHAIKNKSIPADKKATWLGLIFIACAFTVPVYWSLYILPENNN